MWDWSGEDVAYRVEDPESVIDPQHPGHLGESRQRDCGQNRSDQDEFARAEPVNDDGAEPDGERGRKREAEPYIGAGPAELSLEIIVEEADVVVRDSDCEAKRHEGGRRDPPAVELPGHRLHFGRFLAPS